MIISIFLAIFEEARAFFLRSAEVERLLLLHAKNRFFFVFSEISKETGNNVPNIRHGIKENSFPPFDFLTVSELHCSSVYFCLVQTE
jgi:hypothetical protein